MLIATSVFQEGVNLHLQCRKVHHYGIAWTPGDNEQRVGRVDRLFGRVNQKLLEHDEAELAIHYPYLTRSFDQEQLASFIVQKHDVESRLDACKHTDFNDEIDIRKAIDAWEQFLRKPGGDPNKGDPYPARFDSDHMPAHSYRPASEREPCEELASISV
ncbi:helicase-related protein [Aeromonas salmonicida]|uniref:helicase-related protein n=1 Tax=Aeromonas salmonicida TaxID=645 RepID=UPI00223FD0D8